ncbi:proline/glycine betaine ABC transporter permease, partial [Arhodomonas aquaeolei]|nr:proline/glycine betaine ABC transporter permease [Arhodomonas aquaeolei]
MASIFPESFDLPIGEWVESGVDWIQNNLTGLLDGIAAVIGFVSDGLEEVLMFLPPEVLALIIVGIAFWRVGWRFGVFALLAMLVILGMNLWDETVQTLALVLASSFVALVVGIPVGIWMARNEIVEHIVRPILDFMQTMPAFVYLIPAAI